MNFFNIADHILHIHKYEKKLIEKFKCIEKIETDLILLVIKSHFGCRDLL